jgi:co-chaperonin GroES (HSP10)
MENAFETSRVMPGFCAIEPKDETPTTALVIPGKVDMRSMYGVVVNIGESDEPLGFAEGDWVLFDRRRSKEIDGCCLTRTKHVLAVLEAEPVAVSSYVCIKLNEDQPVITEGGIELANYAIYEDDNGSAHSCSTQKPQTEGVVVSVGSKVRDVSPGDKVVCKDDSGIVVVMKDVRYLFIGIEDILGILE